MFFRQRTLSAPPRAAASLLLPVASAALAALTALAAALALAAGTALAHSYLEVTEPADGSTLPRPPERVRVTYTEPVEAGVTRLLLLDPAGKPVPGTRQEAEGRLVLVLHLPADLAPGTYTLRSETLGADGHPTVDEIRFTVSAPAGKQPGAAAGPAGKADGPSAGSAAAGKEAAPPAGETATARSELGTESLILGISLLALAGAIAAIALGSRRRSSRGAGGAGGGGGGE